MTVRVRNKTKVVQADRTRQHDVHQHHEELVRGFKQQMQQVLDYSKQPVLIYLDDTHKTCNEKFAQLLGFHSVQEFEDSDVNFVETYIDESSQDDVVENYHGPFKKDLRATVLDITIKNLHGTCFPVRLVHVPVMYQGHLFAVSFVEKIGYG